MALTLQAFDGHGLHVSGQVGCKHGIDCGEQLVATCQMSDGYGALTYMICATVVALLWRTLVSESDDDEPPETMYN